MNGQAPPCDIEQEQYTLGGVLLSERVLRTLVVDEGLRAHHFYREQHRAVFEAMTRLLDRGEPVDVGTVSAELDRSRSDRDVKVTQTDVDLLTATVPSIGNLRAYARRVVELAELRAKQRGAYTILQGIAAEDREAIEDGERQLVTERSASTTRTAEQLALDAVAFVEAGKVEAWPLPWLTLTNYLAGGFKRGTLTVLSGHSSHGKSIVADQVAEAAAKHGARAHIYLTEMTEQERTLRFISRHSAINLQRLSQAKVRDDEMERFVKAASWFSKLGIGMTDASGWTPEEVARDIILRGWDFPVVDIFNELEVGEGKTPDFDRAVRVLRAATMRANAHLLLVAHVNEARSGTKRPPPVLGDLRSTGMLKNAASNVLFVWRDQSDDGTDVHDDGRIYIAKARNAILGGVDVHFHSARMRFEQTTY